MLEEIEVEEILC